MCNNFFSLLSCLYCHCYLGQGNATRRVLLLVGAGENWNLHDSWPRFLIWQAAVTTFTIGKI